MIPGGETAAGAATAGIFVWILNNFGKEIIKASARNVSKLWQGFSYKDAAQKYAADMKRRYGIMQIWRMPSSVPLEGIFTHVNLLNKPSAFRRAQKEQLESIFLGKATFGKVIEEGKDGLDAVRENHRLFILGKPGAGKTTFLKYITLQAISAKLDRVPIFVPLRHFSESEKSLFAFVTRQFRICNFPDAQPFIKALLKKGKAIVLCDGLDEVNKEGGVRDRVIQELVDFSNEYDKSPFVITCRVAASEYSFEGFTYVEMADFNECQIKTFVYNWFAYDEQIADSLLREFGKIENDRLRDLAKNPLLLTLLCIAFEETLSFPTRRCEIYEEALDALLKKWDTSRIIKRDEIYHRLSLGRKRQMFARIAAETYDNAEYLFEQKDLEKKIVKYLQNLPQADRSEDIDGVAVIKSIEDQHGIFVEQAQGIYSFSHLTFQEYYAARYIVDHIHEGALKDLIRNHFNDTSWRETFLLTVEMLDDTDDFFAIFLSTLDDFVVQDEALERLLAKTEREANDINMEAEPFMVRSAIIFLIISAIAIDSAIDINSVSVSDIVRYIASASDSAIVRSIASASDSAIVRSIASDSDIVRSIASDSDSAIVRSIAIARSIASAVDSVIANVSDSAMIRSIDIARSIAGAIAIDTDSVSSIDIARSNYNNALKLSKQKGLTELHLSLADLSVPSETASYEEWRGFAQALKDILETHRSIESYKFTTEQALHFSEYLDATKLLLDCLEIAYVSDRNAIKDRLLRARQRRTGASPAGA